MNGYNKKQINYFKGILSEIYVLLFLTCKGYRFVAWRMRNYYSEIDLIVKKHNVLIAVEVKYRQSYDVGLFAVSKQQQIKIRKAFEIFSSKNCYQSYEKRCDICVVIPRLKIYHDKNSF